MLELKDISFQRDGKMILDHINLKIEDRKFVVITGPNGSGKSTFAKIIMGINKPDSGKIYLNGEDITDLDITARAKKGIGFAFQQPITFKGLTVKDLIELAAEEKLKMNEVCEYLSDVGLCAKEYIDRELNSKLSGGELKRIEIAMMEAKKSMFTIFDEPEAGIDLWSFTSLINVFEKLNNKTQGSILVISHQEKILDIADHIILLVDGKIAKIGEKKEILPMLLTKPKNCPLVEKEGK